MNMVMAIIPRDQANRVLEALISAGHGATFTESRGGMLRQAQELLFIAVQKDKLEEVIQIIRDSCHTKVAVESDHYQDAPETGTMSFDGEANGFSAERAPVTAELGGAVVFVWELGRFETY